MGRASYGPVAQRRTLEVLKLLLKIANLEVDLPDHVAIDYRWSDKSNRLSSLTIKTTLSDLLKIDQTQAKTTKQTTESLRTALKALRDYLEILTDHRINPRGTTTWYFTLDLWSRCTELNLKQAERLWQQKRSSESVSPVQDSLSISHQDVPALDLSCFSKILEDYAQWYRQSYGVIKILPGLMQRPISLDAVYVDVKVLDQQSKRLLSPNALETFYQKFQSRSLFGSELLRRDGLVVARECPYLMVLGSPGIGKSIFLKKLGLHAFADNDSAKDKQIPILIELNRLEQSQFNLKNIIHQVLFKQKHPNSRAYVEHYLRQGSFLLLLDGLDEVSETQRGILVQHVQEFIENFPKNQVVISCRTAAHYFSFTQFVDVVVAEFSDAQVRSFLDNWFEAHTNYATKQAVFLWDFINQRNNAPLKELARTPLLLTYLCLVFESVAECPATRNLLYAQVLNLFLKDWEQQKNLSVAEHPQLPLYLQKQLLSEIAYETFKAEQLFIPQTYLRQKVLTFLKDHISANSDIDPDSFLQHLATRQGLLAERFQDRWSFSHLTLQEYLVAQFIIHNAQTDFLLNEFLTSPRWREVVISTAESLDGEAYSYLVAIQAQANRFISENLKLKKILSWSQNSLKASSSFALTLSERASLIAAFSAIAASRASDFDIDNSVGYKIAFALVTGCESAVAIAQEGSAIYQAAVTSSVTIAAARASAADEARAINIDYVIRGAQDLIDDVSNESGILREYDRARIVRRGIGFSSQIANIAKQAPSSFSEILTELDRQLTNALETVPDETANVQTWREWSERLEKSWIQAFRCSKDLMTLTLAEAEAFEKYLYLIELLIHCIDSAWQVPESKRQTLKQGLLV
ncbi:MAG: NACHT domain-containing protein [Cyanobacteria bacterium P01_D01_bin.156]